MLENGFEPYYDEDEVGEETAGVAMEAWADSDFENFEEELLTMIKEDEVLDPIIQEFEMEEQYIQDAFVKMKHYEYVGAA